MNIIGKILVVLNLLFALAVGAFMVVDFATRSNYKNELDKARAEFLVMNASRDTGVGMTRSLAGQNTKLDLENKELRQKLADQETEARALDTKHKIEIADYLAKLKDADLTSTKQVAEHERLKTEIGDRNKTIKDRESRILALEADVTRYRQDAIAQETRAITAMKRAEQLQEDLQRMTQIVRKLEAGAGGGPAGSANQIVRNPNDPNPPATRVHGQIERVEPSENGLVEISLGTDQGVNKNNTLEVFRRAPQPQYLGMIRIIEAYHDRSVGRRVQSVGGSTNVPLRQGDEVATDLRR